jgi:hypothetical protein
MPVSLCKRDVRPSEWTEDGEGVQVRVEGYRETREWGCPLGKYLSTPQPVTITDRCGVWKDKAMTLMHTHTHTSMTTVGSTTTPLLQASACRVGGGGWGPSMTTADDAT